MVLVMTIMTSHYRENPWRLFGHFRGAIRTTALHMRNLKTYLKNTIILLGKMDMRGVAVRSWVFSCNKRAMTLTDAYTLGRNLKHDTFII